ncbi:hypothetical protein [Salana multivorans]
MSHLAPRLIGGALLAALALTACTPPYGDRDPHGTPTPEDSATPSPSPSGDTRPTDSTETDGGDEGLGETTLGTPDGVDPSAGAADAAAGVGWSSDGATLYVTTFGSSSCPNIPSDLTAADGTIEITLTTSGGAVCTMDYVPATTAIPAPEGVPTTITQTMTIADVGSTDLPPAADPIAYAWIAVPPVS